MQINYGKREISCKLVYYGPGMSGKTTNLEIIHQKVPDQNKGEMTSIATEGDRTLFFDFLPLDLGNVRGMTTKFQLYTVPGQVYYSSTRKLVLQGADGVIFVADSQKDKLPENLESLKDLESNLDDYGLELNKIPLVIQWNKRDLPNAMSVEELEEKINWPGAPTTNAVAVTGEGVLSTLKLAASLILDRLNAKEPDEVVKAVKSARESEPKKEPVKEETYVAKINDDNISKSYFSQYCQVQYRLATKSEDIEDFKKFSPEARKRLIESLINHVLLLQDAKKRNIEALSQEIDRQVDNFAKRLNGSNNLEEYLSARKLTVDNLRNEATKNVIIGKVIKDVIPNVNERLKITEGEVREFYNDNKAKLGGKAFDDVKNVVVSRIKNIRKRALLDEFFEKLRKEATIEIYTENIYKGL